MRINKLYIVIGMILALGLLFEISAHADDSNQETTITFNAPIEIPGQVLSAGTYRFQLVAPDSDQDLVQIFSADGTRLYATLHTVEAERAEASGDAVVTLAAVDAGTPDLLVKWFYPGNTVGHQFVYSKQQEQKLSHGREETSVGNQPPSAGSAGGN
jgi:hypothetical protein